MKYSLTKREHFGWRYRIEPGSLKESLHFMFADERNGFAFTKEGADRKARRKIKRYQDGVNRETNTEWREA